MTTYKIYKRVGLGYDIWCSDSRVWWGNAFAYTLRGARRKIRRVSAKSKLVEQIIA